MTFHTRTALPFRAATVAVTLAAASLSIQHSYGAQAVAVDRGSRDYTLPDQMQWRATEDGTTSSLYGDPSKPGLYAYIVKRGPNMWSMPHFHDNDVFVTNARPQVHLDAPTNDSKFLEPANITITATAVDPDGSVVSIAFYSGTNKLSESAFAPIPTYASAPDNS